MNEYNIFRIFNEKYNYHFAIVCQNMNVCGHDDIEVIYGNDVHMKIVYACRQLAMDDIMYDETLEDAQKQDIFNACSPLLEPE